MDILELLGLKPKGTGPTPGAPPISAPKQPMDERMPGRYDHSPDLGGITVTGDNWKPRKPNFLHFLADVVNHHYGNGYLATQLLDRENTTGALQDYATDPLQAIKRLSMLPGHQKEAVAMYNQYADNKRADDQAAAIVQERQNKVRDRIGAMMGATNEKNYSSLLPTMRRYAEARGLDPSEIPETYNPDEINAYRMGSMTVDQQMDNDRADDNTDSVINYRNSQIGLSKERVGLQRENTQSEISHRSAQEAETIRHHTAIENKPSSGNKAFKTVQTPRGPGLLSPQGFLRLISDGSTWARNPQNNGWIKVKEGVKK